MRIAVATGIFHPEQGGPATYLYHLCNALAARGHVLEVLCFGEGGDKVEYPYRVVRISRRQPIPLRLVRYTLALLPMLRRCQVVYVNDYGLPPAVLTLLIHRPIVLKVVGDFAWEKAITYGYVPPDLNIDDFQARRHDWRVRLLQAIQRFYCLRADAIITPSQYFKGMIAGWGVPPEKIHVIYNTVERAPFEGLGDQAVARRRLGLNGGPLLLTVARLVPWKGVDELIRLLPELRERVPGLRLIVVGDGPLRPHLEQLAATLGLKDAVCFTGQVDRTLVPYYFRAADAFVLYSGYEGFSHVLLESMAAGTPAVASAKGGNLELIEDGVSGRLVPWGDRAALREALVEVLTQPDRAAAYAAAARARIEAMRWETLVEQTEALLVRYATLSCRPG